MKHIDFDDIVKMVYSKKINDEYTKLAIRVNKHIYACPQCRQAYDAVCLVRDIQEDYRAEVSAENAVVKILQKIYQDNDLSLLSNNLIDSLIGKIKNQESVIRINIKPSFVTSVACAIKSPDRRSQNVKPTDIVFCNRGTELKHAMTDSNCNKISVAKDGTLSIQFKKQLIDEGNAVFLIPNDKNSDVSIEKAKITEDGMPGVSFRDVKPGDYTVLY